MVRCPECKQRKNLRLPGKCNRCEDNKDKINDIKNNGDRNMMTLREHLAFWIRFNRQQIRAAYQKQALAETDNMRGYFDGRIHGYYSELDTLRDLAKNSARKEG